MSRSVQIAYLTHSIRSDWNNGNAHFIRGLMRELQDLGAEILVFEPANSWSYVNLCEESNGRHSLQRYTVSFSHLPITVYDEPEIASTDYWHGALRDADVVILHEWNPPALASTLLAVRETLHFCLLFHDTHHRASSSPAMIREFGLARFDGVLAFGASLRGIYRDRFGLDKVWTLHEAADTTIFHPLDRQDKETDVVWIGNWGDDERSREILEFLLTPASLLPGINFSLFGVRYPAEALDQLRQVHAAYRGYLPNLDAPEVYASASITMHIPRQQYSEAMTGIPTIRVFEALACGIPLISAPWHDTEGLFPADNFLMVSNCNDMTRAIQHLLGDPAAAEEQAQRGLETVLARHTCRHRAEQLLNICEEVLP